MPLRTLELAVIFAVACLASFVAWKLHHVVFAGVFAAAAVAAFTGARPA
jgi:hypothetical protein